MSRYLERAKELREDPEVHYNCAQAVLMAFSDEAGLSREQAFRIAANFGSGMKSGRVCGAITGGLMALGLFDVTGPDVIGAYWKSFREAHGGLTDCRDLLAENAKAGLPKKQHCDGMVYEAVKVTEKILREQGKIS